MILLEALLQALQNVQRFLAGRLPDIHGLKAPCQGTVMLDGSGVFRRCGGADEMQLATGKGRLEEICRIDGTLRCAGAHDGVQLVNEQDDPPVCLDLVHAGTDSLLKIATVFRPGKHCAEVKGKDAFPGKLRRNVTACKALCDALHDRCFSNTGVADETGVVFGAACEDLEYTLNLRLTPDQRVGVTVVEHEFAVAEQMRKVLLGRNAHLGSDWRCCACAGLLDAVQVSVQPFEHLGCGTGLILHDGKQQELRPDALHTLRLRTFLRSAENAVQCRCHAVEAR